MKRRHTDWPIYGWPSINGAIFAMLILGVPLLIICVIAIIG